MGITTKMNGKPSTWNRMMVHATFKKVVAFDLLFLGLGSIVGLGIGAALVLAA